MIADGLREFFESNQYEYVDVGNGCFRLRFSGNNGDYNMFAQAAEDPGHVMVFTYCPVRVPENRRMQVADYINRVNYDLVIGCLEMDPADGEVRSRSSAPVGPGEPGPSVLGPLFDSTFYMIDNWLPGLLRVAFGSADPAIAYQAMLDALNCHHSEPDRTDGDEPESRSEAEPELIAIEQQVARLLADSNSESSAPAE